MNSRKGNKTETENIKLKLNFNNLMINLINCLETTTEMISVTVEVEDHCSKAV